MRQLSSNGHPHGITLSCVVQRQNYRLLVDIAERARQWKAGVNFSTYTWRRTGEKERMVPVDELDELRGVLGQLVEHKRRHRAVFTSEYVLGRIPEFFARGAVPDCQAGRRFLVVNPDGTLSPCGLIITAYRSRQELLDKFSRTNTCGDCYTSLRANAEKPARWLVKDNLERL
jgi:MoaA/NifB/PqqE/SkfB family radical SAM enzyme